MQKNDVTKLEERLAKLEFIIYTFERETKDVDEGSLRGIYYVPEAYDLTNGILTLRKSELFIFCSGSGQLDRVISIFLEVLGIRTRVINTSGLSDSINQNYLSCNPLYVYNPEAISVFDDYTKRDLLALIKLQ